jgi:hypothetical protein
MQPEIVKNQFRLAFVRVERVAADDRPVHGLEQIHG